MKRWLSLLLVVVMLFSLCGCSDSSDLFDGFDVDYEDDYDDDDYADETEEPAFSRVTIPSMPSYNYATTTTTAATTTTTRYTFYTTSSSSVPKYTYTTRYTYPSYSSASTTRTTTTTRYTTTTTASQPQFSTLTALRDYFTKQRKAGISKYSFRYTGSTELTGRLIAQMSIACSITYWNRGNGSYTVQIYDYPGDRIVKAYRTGDKSALNSAEVSAMNKAIQMVNEAKAATNSTFELERKLHDMLCKHITYYDTDRDVDDPENPPRFLTVVGALLDGKANCQGYTDAFYVLASMAGFTVSRMNVYCPNDLHMVNSIYLNNEWYVVDVTLDDTNDGEINYRLFNAGVDVIEEFKWDPEKEVEPIARNSGIAYYYNYTNTTYDTLQAFANDVAAKWSNTGTMEFRGRVKNVTQGTSLKAILNEALNKTGKRYSYKYWYYENGKDCYYTLRFS